jgi:hypothetical protein
MQSKSENQSHENDRPSPRIDEIAPLFDGLPAFTPLLTLKR